MNINSYFMVAGIVLLGAITFTEGQDCEDYAIITDSRRTTEQVFNGNTDSPISDTDIDENKWYRFRSYVGNKIPEREVGNEVQMNRCGTSYPMYIIGLNQHPQRDYEKTTATVKVPTQEGRQISIYQCPPDSEGPSFYIYNLVAAPADEIAYCAGEGQPCAADFMHNGYECVDYLPAMKGNPIFSGPHTTGDNADKQAYFKCQVQYDRVPNDASARFMITFVFDGDELEYIETPHKRLPSFHVGPTGDIFAHLTEYYLQGRLGKEIHCKVRSYWLQNSEQGLALASVNKYNATLEAVETFYFDLEKGGKQTIPFHSTLPFTYFHCSTHLCPLPFIYQFFVETEVALEDEIDCTLRWNGDADPELVVEIKPFASVRTFKVKFQPYTGDFVQESSALWHNFKIPTVTIQAFHSSPKWCTSTGDPHVTTFDGILWHTYLSGDFYLVREEIERYKLEIQVRQENCYGSVACNCGVIVRELNSVVKVMYTDCGGNAAYTSGRPISVLRLLKQIPEDGTEITRDNTGRKFSVRMPSGTRVEIDASAPHMNLLVNLAPMYKGKLSRHSMCGNCDDDPNDDSIDPAIFRIEFAKSYFNAQPDCYKEYFPAATTCSCSDSGMGVNCSNVEQNIAMKSPANTKLPNVRGSKDTCKDPDSALKSKHSIDEDDADYIVDEAELFPPFVPDPSAGQNLTMTWPTPKNKTKEEVAQYCTNMLKASPVFSDCNAVANTDRIMENCVLDTQFADEYISTTTYSDEFGQECINVLIEQESNATSGGPPPTVVVSNIYKQVCPAQCSGHGTCTNATCTCDTGFTGADCSINETLPPVLTGIARSGICDVQQRPCAAVSVFGYSIIPSETLKCRFSAMGGGSELDTVGTLITSSEISCAVPNTTTERTAISRQGVSIANDGKMYGNVLEFVTFDSLCMSCGQDKVCTQKTDSCLISNRCYANGATGVPETCQQCRPSQSVSSWTVMPVTESLKPCSRSCDYGAQSKDTVCTINDVTVKTEPVLCQSSICAAIPEENLQGVVLTVTNEDTAKILLTPTDILAQVSQVVNNYCSAHATECCNSVGIPNGNSLNSFTSLELCPYGSGYPKVGDASSRIKVIVKIIPSQVQSECGQSAPKQSAVSTPAYANPDIILAAVTEGKHAIEQALNITIAFVEKDKASDSDNGAGFPVYKHTLTIFTAVAAFALTRLI